MARKTSGSSCGRTGSQIGSSNPSTISSITAATLGTPSLINLGKSCPSRAATGQPWVTQCEDWYYTLIDVTVGHFFSDVALDARAGVRTAIELDFGLFAGPRPRYAGGAGQPRV